MLTEYEELLSQAGGSVGGLLHLRNVRLEITIRRKTVGQELGVAEDCLQQIVEVMGDPASQLSDCLHSLSLPEDLLRLGFTGEHLVELGISRLELLDHPECLIPANDGNIEEAGEDHREQKANEQ